jgi:oligosaccharyltransferase complex subunit beta
LTPNILLEFAQKNGNILLGLSADVPTPTTLVSLLLELDIHLSPDRNALVVDHFNYDSASAAEKHDVLLLTPPPSLRADVKNYFSGEGVLAVPRAVGQVLGNTSPLLTPILKAPATAYSYNPKEEAEGAEDPFATGSQLSLISAMQARNSARFTVLGSAEMLEDKWFDAQVTASGSGDQSQGPSVATGNREFAKKIAGWTFQEIGVLRVGRVSHHLNGDDSDVSPVNNTGREVTRKSDEGRKMYRIKNDVVCPSNLWHMLETLTECRRHTPSSSQNTPGTTSPLSHPPRKTCYNSSSPC